MSLEKQGESRFKEFKTKFLEQLQWAPGRDQEQLIESLGEFMLSQALNPCLIVQGYAGTGKTSILSAFVKLLKAERVRTKLLAPTGRAAKVFSRFSGQEAVTIHKQIYRRKSRADLSSPLSLQPNLFKNTVFIVDEASMIGDYTMGADGSVNARNLLKDLVEYVFSGENCRLILVGDVGQLPPVGSDHSPALNPDYIHNYFPAIKPGYRSLKEVMRQSDGSGVLHNATLLRNTIGNDYPKLNIIGFNDIVRINGSELQETIESCYDQEGQEETIIVTRSNKRANAYNQQIRGRILWFEGELSVGDMLMVVKNNYFWIGEDSRLGFIANGEIVEVSRILKYEEFYGFRFAKVMVSFVDYDGIDEMEVIIHLEGLIVESTSLSGGRMRELFFEVEKDYFHITNKKKRYEAILGNAYFNALQVKYAYAVTCHKSQGGQWANVLVDTGYINEDMLGPEFYRWLYTALTRSTSKVYLVNFSDQYFDS